MKTLRAYIVVGRPQIFALLLLSGFAVQVALLIREVPFTREEQDHIWAGRQQIEWGAVPRSFRYSPLVNVASAIPLRIDANRVLRRDPTPEFVKSEVVRLRWMLRTPFLIIGLLLGVSVWYVARRLYGNSGGYIALALYCFSPAMVVQAAQIGEVVPAGWGIFGTIFGAIAVSHNLYAPWKQWRYRTLLLSIATALAVASHPAAISAFPAAVAFMIYLAPRRRMVAIPLALTSAAIAAALIFFAYSFEPQALWSGIDLRQWFAYQPAQARQTLFQDSGQFLSRFNPAIATLFLVGLVTYFVWKRSRYFGNSAPLLCLSALLYLSLITPLTLTVTIWALPFLFVFVGGMWADLLETNHRMWVMGALILLLSENAWLCWMMVRQTRLG